MRLLPLLPLMAVPLLVDAPAFPSPAFARGHGGGGTPALWLSPTLLTPPGQDQQDFQEASTRLGSRGQGVSRLTFNPVPILPGPRRPFKSSRK
jgi:hypothetical protein